MRCVATLHRFLLLTVHNFPVVRQLIYHVVIVQLTPVVCVGLTYRHGVSRFTEGCY
ncbi:hypothetical protein BBB56_19780 [Candidatus Pantoea deserta]|uniref:Uncharacterized protein n=1 Tax=Candidatus Pantoea deserta TaxID=1869313 RepID=A0A3N4NS28_9GAMM|nr:hypothetical protein BBB56_19780 [Pantoea deserta]